MNWNAKRILLAKSPTADDWNETKRNSSNLTSCERDVPTKASNGMSQLIKAKNLPFKCILNACSKFRLEKDTHSIFHEIIVNRSMIRNYNWICRLFHFRLKLKHNLAHFAYSVPPFDLANLCFSNRIYLNINRIPHKSHRQIISKNGYFCTWQTPQRRKTHTERKRALNINQRSIVFFAEKSNCYKTKFIITLDQPWRVNFKNAQYVPIMTSAK